jgi:hypothetical protein
MVGSHHTILYMMRLRLADVYEWNEWFFSRIHNFFALFSTVLKSVKLCIVLMPIFRFYEVSISY